MSEYLAMKAINGVHEPTAPYNAESAISKISGNYNLPGMYQGKEMGKAAAATMASDPKERYKIQENPLYKNMAMSRV